MRFEYHWDVGIPYLSDSVISGYFETREGSRSMIALVAASKEPLVFPPRAEIEARLNATMEFWKSWSSALRYNGPWQKSVLRSALEC